jgi:hypothetical protein
VQLDGTGSYDPDNSGTLSYAWQQIDGSAVFIVDADTATPTICGSMQPGIGRNPTPTLGGFIQTDEIQECEFELVVSDGELTSLPDTVKVIIVPDFDSRRLQQENPPFDPDKPTVIYSGGGDCVTGGGDFWGGVGWPEKANIISFSYWPDSVGDAPTYYKYGDVIIVYLSAVAPDYKQPIQTIGFSAGGDPAIDVGIHLNRVYRDARYAVNRVTLLDGACRWINQGVDFYFEIIDLFEKSSVAGEQCWIDDYYTVDGGGHNLFPCRDELPVSMGLSHTGVRNWYRNSLTGNDMNNFNSGVVAGAYWSVIGPGKNLQLASETDAYYFRWDGNEQSGGMSIYDEAQHPGRLTEPITLWGWRDSLDPKGVVLTCKASDNAIGYELLLGPDPYRVMDYNIVSDTPIRPREVITNFPFEETWWTIRARDQHGSTIYADPMRVDLENLPWPTIENITTGQTYGYIQAAIDHAGPGDEIVIGPGTYHENISFEGKNLIVRSTNPDDPATVAATVINGGDQGSVVTLSGTQETNCVLAGLTILGGTVGVSCRAGSLTIRNCTIESNGPIAIEFWEGYEPQIIDCTILGQVVEVYDPALVAYWKLDEAEGSIAYDSAGDKDGTLTGDPTWQPTAGQIDGALAFDGTDDYVSTDVVLNPADGPFSVFAWIKGGAPAQVIISQGSGVNWLMADAVDGALRTDLKEPAGGGRSPTPPGPPLISPIVITDGEWHWVGFVRDGSSRILYVDDIEVARDTAETLESAETGLYIGAGSTLEAGSLFSGLIDDVRIYNRAVKP